MSTAVLTIVHYVLRWGGLGAIALAAFFLVGNAYFWLRAESVAGTVLENTVMRSSTPRPFEEPALAPLIRFQTEKGEEVTFVSNIGYGRHFAFTPGKAVPVLYLASKPQEAKVASLVELFVLPPVLAVFGGAMWIAGIFVQFLAEPHERKTNRIRPNV